MHTLLSAWRPDQDERLTDYVTLTRDTRVPLVDRLSLRVGLWLLVAHARRDHRRRHRATRTVRIIAREEHYRAVREAALQRAATQVHFR